MPQDKIAAGAPAVDQAACVACHDEQGAELPAVRCAACHARDERAAAPADHVKTWRLRHGAEARWPGTTSSGTLLLTGLMLRR
mgnify:CR=1 FL=1